MPSYARLLSKLLDKPFASAIQPVLNALAAQPGSLLATSLTALNQEVVRLTAAGQALGVDNVVLRALLADLDQTMTQTSYLINATAPQIQLDALAAGQEWFETTTLGGLTESQLAQLGYAFNRVDPQTVLSATNYLTSEAWRESLAAFPSEVVQSIQNIALNGILQGMNPRQTAALLSDAIDTLPAFRAESMMRTLQLQSYRQAMSQSQLANSDILEKQIRIASLDNRTCFIAGTLITTSKGLMPIELVEIGDLVLTHLGNYKRVTATMKRNYKGDAIIIKTLKTSITTTDNHPILVQRGSNCDWVSAKDCHVGDLAFIARNNFLHDRNHFTGDFPIKGNIRNTNNNESLSNQAGDFSPISIGTFMPIDSIYFKCNIQAWQMKVNGIAVNACLLFIRLLQMFKTEPHIHFWFCLSYISAIATRGTKLLMRHRRNNTEIISAGEASLDHGRATTYLRTISIAIAVFSKRFTTTFTNYLLGIDRFASITTNTIPISIGFGNGKYLTANGASFSNITSFGAASPTTKTSIPFENFGRSQNKFLAANLASERNTLALSNTTTVGTTIDSGTFPFGNGKGTLADQTHFFNHDMIVSKIAMQIQCEVYNLEVEDDHSYVANGLAVHNCLACIALHGTVLKVGEVIKSHYNCRCTAVAIVKGRPLQIETGIDWFNRQDTDTQRAMLGNRAFEEYQAGNVRLPDFIQPVTDPIYGAMLREGSLRFALEAH